MRILQSFWLCNILQQLELQHSVWHSMKKLAPHLLVPGAHHFDGQEFWVANAWCSPMAQCSHNLLWVLCNGLSSNILQPLELKYSVRDILRKLAPHHSVVPGTRHLDDQAFQILHHMVLSHGSVWVTIYYENPAMSVLLNATFCSTFGAATFCKSHLKKLIFLFQAQ